MSETSPPTPMTVVELKGRRRLTSVKRAREPYEAVDGRDGQLRGLKGQGYGR